MKMNANTYAMVKTGTARVFVRRKDLPAYKSIFPNSLIIGDIAPSSDHLTAFIGLPGFPICVERGVAVMAGKTLSIGRELMWCDHTGKRLFEFEDGVLVGKRN